MMSTAENRLELSVKILVNMKTQIPHVVRSEGLSKKPSARITKRITADLV